MDYRAILDMEYWDNTVQQYLISLGIIIAAAVVARIIKHLSSTWLKKFAEKTKTQADDIVLELVDRPLYSLLIVLGTYWALKMLTLPERIGVLIHHTMVLATALVAVLTINRLIHIVFQTYGEKMAEKTESRMDDQILPVLRRFIKGVVWILAILLVLDNFEYDVMALITGLGIGGIAVAMAAKDTLSNMLGGITIFIDQPFKIEDIVNVGGYLGKVEEVGLRTTRVRTFEGHLVTIPNSVAASTNIENISARPSIRVRFNMGLSYDTTLEKCRDTVDLVVKAVGEVEGVLQGDDGPSVYFVEFNDSTLDFQLTYYIDLDFGFFDVKHAANLAIKETLAEAGVSMAFPTVTLDAPEDMFHAPKAA
jgi:MscS family membrane protein